MKINLEALVKTIDGKDFGYPTVEGKVEEKPTTLQAAMFSPLVAQLKGDENLTLVKKLEIHKLASRVSQSSGVIAMTSEEISVVKERASKLYGIHLLGQMVSLLEEQA